MHTTWDWFGVLDLYWVSNFGWECGFGRSLLGLKFLVGNGDVFGFGLVWLTLLGLKLLVGNGDVSGSQILVYFYTSCKIQIFTMT